MARLFAKEKDIVLKIINLVIVLFLIITVLIAFGTGIKMLSNKTVTDYKTYSKEVCMLDEIPSEEIDMQLTKSNCYQSFIEAKKEEDDFSKKNIDNFLISISSTVILSIFLHILNKSHK